MSKKDHIKHLMETTGVNHPSMGGDKDEWKKAFHNHLVTGCDKCQDRLRTIKAGLARKERDSVMKSCGLVKVRGAVSGRTYWE